MEAMIIGKKYLNMNVRFKCQSGIAVWFKPMPSDSNTKINSANILLDDCKLQLVGPPRPGQCPLNPDKTTGAPLNCLAQTVSGMWKNQSKVTVSGKKALLTNCSITCPLSGIIKPFNPTIVAINVDNNAKAQEANANDNKGGMNSHNETGEMTEEKMIDSKYQSNNHINNENDFASEKSKKGNNSKSVEEVLYALCDYKNCTKADECKYLSTSHCVKETNESKNAKDLRNNLGKDMFDLYAQECGDIATISYESYLYKVSHHHIVPVNQCFKSFAEIVKLANFYGYDINKAENGICLPTMNTGYNKQTLEERKKIAFNAMQTMGKQWHKGGHQYSCKISAKIDGVLTRPFLHYKDAVDKELMSYSIKLTDEMKCRTENFEKQSEEFTKIMDHICEKIAKKLRHFEDDARKSYPCYISKFAFYYAFQEELTGYEEELFGKDG